MTPQSNIMVVAPIIAGKEDELNRLLASMNQQPGLADPANLLVPFGQFNTVHFARFVILDNTTREDLLAYGVQPPDATKFLAFLCDFDGPPDSLLHELHTHAEQGLRQIFSCCQSFDSHSNLIEWMQSHQQAPATAYVNWLGRTVKQVREEEDLKTALETQLDTPTLQNATPRQTWNALRQFVQGEQIAGRLKLTPPEPTPFLWRLMNLLHCLGVPLLLLLASPLLLLYLPIFLILLRNQELHNPEIAPKPAVDAVMKLATIEDRAVTNQFSAYGNLKPGLFRLSTLAFLLFVVNYTTRHIYNRGFLARVNTIHFARWVFLGDHTRLFFASNYDGGLETYMGDFINKVAWGLNLVFSNGIGYPKTNWLLKDGAKNEEKFKYFLRRHQLPTQVWYDATPDLTAYDMERNSRIRDGIDQQSMTDTELAEWIKLF
jgi:hypothetical protein